MYISTEIHSYQHWGKYGEIVKLLKDSGFTAYDFSMFGEKWMKPCEFLHSADYIAQAKALRAIADELGMVCNQSHAPFPTLVKDNEEYNERMFDDLVRAIEVYIPNTPD